MKIKKLRIENFKGVKSCEIDFTSPFGSSPRTLTALVGDNGSGKTSVLQAIALIISIATRRTRNPAELRWLGFRADRLGTLGKTRVEIEISFSEDELQATQELYEQWQDPAIFSRPPSREPLVQLIFENGRVTSPQGAAAYFQFFGRYYIKTRLEMQPELRSYFRRVGDVFWFDQLRNLGSKLEERRQTQSHEGDDFEPVVVKVESWTAGVEQLREDLVHWWGYHTSPQKDVHRDFLARVEPYLDLIFPGTKFSGVSPRNTASLGRPDFDFLFERGGITYDLAELSSGEQAVFPLLSEFVRLEIARSLVLIDELELHLHPPQQQALLGALRKLGPDCQFIVTTHSPYLTDVIPDEEIVRLEGGQSCT
ncbi:MAG TPA: AAA family ATPase [Polyangium sp.]|nr:AAA family ATPase [Polyangium sp.]